MHPLHVGLGPPEPVPQLAGLALAPGEDPEQVLVLARKPNDLVPRARRLGEPLV